MSDQSAELLRKAMNRVDRDRRRSRALLFGLLAMTVANWLAMMFAKDEHRGLPFGLAAVIGAVFVAGMMATNAAYDNTRTVLSAIESIAQDKSIPNE